MTSRSLTASRAMRLALLLAAIAGITLITAAPALAQQRDPFDPLVSSGSVDDTGTAADSTQTQADAGTTTTTQPVVQESSLPNTGSNVSEWLVVAYVLVATGAGLLVLTKILQPTAERR
jgi:LPXTG-motif cell wall-anchored protein